MAKAKGEGRAKKAEAKIVNVNEARKYLDKIHGEVDKMEEQNAATRGRIAGVYDNAAEKMGVTKTALKKIYKAERGQKKVEKWAEERAGVDDRESLNKLADSLGDLGGWARDLANRIPDERGEGVEE